MGRLSYLDHAATTPVDERVVAAMLPYLQSRWGNPSSLYTHGRIARRALDEARDTVAGLLGCRANEVLFTGGGTEADYLAIEGVAFARRDEGRHLVTTSVEHHAVLHTLEWLERHFGFEVTYVEVDRHGQVDVERFERALRPDTILASVMMANNEIGTIQPIAELARVARARGVTFHTDAVQAGGAIEIDVARLGVDLLSLSAHKLYGPKGVGTLYVRRGTPMVSPLQGGGQERGLRSGTENTPGIVGMAEALRLAHEERDERNEQARRLRDRLIEGILAGVPGSWLTGHQTERLPNNASFVFADTDGESILLNLDEHGICASSGSACTSGTLEVSHVIKALRLPPELVRGSLRLTTGRETTEADVERVLEVIAGVIDKVRALTPTLLGT